MATIVKGTVPADEFALAGTFEALPEVRVECEPVVCGGERANIPLLWARGVGESPLRRAFDADGSVLESVLLLSAGETHLCRLTWTGSVRETLRTVVGPDATVMDATGDGDRWTLRVLYPTREDLAAAVATCEERGLSFEVDRIRELDETPSGRYGLTRGQYEALVTAYDHGYFEVPRRTSARDIAGRLGISQQAFSERLRRGCNALIADTLAIERRAQLES